LNRDADISQLGIIGHDVNEQVFPPAPNYVAGSESLYSQYQSDIGQVNPKSLMHTLNPTENQAFTGPSSPSRMKAWERFSESKIHQDSLLQGASAAMTLAMASGRASYVADSVWKKLEVATNDDTNRPMVQDLSKLIRYTLDEQDVYLRQMDEKGSDADE